MERRYRAAFIADIHGSNKLPYSKPTKQDRTDRLDDQIALLRRFRASAEEYDVDAIYVLGDLYDKSLVDPVTLTHIVEEVVSWPFNTYILPGNHEANSLRGGRFAVEAFGVMGRDHLFVIGNDVEPVIIDDWLNFWPIAFMPVGATKRRIEAIRGKINKKCTNVLLMHNSVLGANHQGWTCDDGLLVEEVCNGFNWTLSGHFHTPQKFGGTGLYLGAPMHHHYGDVGRKAGWWIMDFCGGDLKRKFIDGAAPRFHILDGIDKKTASKISKGDYARIEINATSEDWVKMKPEVKAYCAALDEKGINSSFRHIPIARHGMRMASSKTAAMTLDEAVAKYPETASVEIGSLDKKKLKSIGLEALQAARGEYGVA